MRGTKIEKTVIPNEDGSQSFIYDMDKYLECSQWCNENNAIIQDKGDYFEVADVPEQTTEEKQTLIQAQLTVTVQSWMDKAVQARNYDNIHTACTYANSTDEIFKAEGKACIMWRDDVWRACYNILNEVLSGTREIPTAEELIAELPKLEW